jgi:3-methyladenine DNA glycosylase AlkD
MKSWAADFDNWAICDEACGHLFCKTEFAYQKVFEWSQFGGREAQPFLT